jgi:hypothetical protein
MFCLYAGMDEHDNLLGDRPEPTSSFHHNVSFLMAMKKNPYYRLSDVPECSCDLEISWGGATNTRTIYDLLECP